MDEEEEILVQQHGDGTAFRWRILQMVWTPKDDQNYHKKLRFFSLIISWGRIFAVATLGAEDENPFVKPGDRK